MYQCLNGAIPSRKCSITAPAEWSNSVYVLTEICHQRIKWLDPIFLIYLVHNNWLHSWMWSRRQTGPENHCRGQSHLPIWNNRFKEKIFILIFIFIHKIKILNAFCSRCSTLIVATDTKQLSHHMLVEYLKNVKKNWIFYCTYLRFLHVVTKAPWWWHCLHVFQISKFCQKDCWKKVLHQFLKKIKRVQYKQYFLIKYTISWELWNSIIESVHIYLCTNFIFTITITRKFWWE